MTKYGLENWERFQLSGVKPEDIKAMKIEAVRDAFLDTKADFAKLIGAVTQGIKESRWTAILGDDVSGRLVADVIGKLASQYAHENGKEPPERIFFAGGSVAFNEDETDASDYRDETTKQRENLQKYIRLQSSKLGKRVLVVTEHIMGGRTIRRLGEVLNKIGVGFDVASLWFDGTVSSTKSKIAHYDPTAFSGVEWYGGRENAGASGPFGSEMSNVLYNLGAPLKEAAGVKKKGAEAITKRDKATDRALVEVAREETQKMADELYKKYFQEST